MAESAPEEEDSEGFIHLTAENAHLIGNIRTLMELIRKCVQMFNKSSDKQKKLQAYVKKLFNKQLKLIHDVKHV